MFYKPKQNFQKTMKEAKIDISVFQKKNKPKKHKPKPLPWLQDINTKYPTFPKVKLVLFDQKKIVFSFTRYYSGFWILR